MGGDPQCIHAKIAQVIELAVMPLRSPTPSSLLSQSCEDRVHRIRHVAPLMPFGVDRSLRNGLGLRPRSRP